MAQNAAEPKPPYAPEQALSLLKEGNARFAAGRSVHPDLGLARLREVAETGQRPFAAVLACSDSREPVELLFDRGIGDLFVIRVAGNVCSTDEIGSIEYALARLEVPLLVVLGHTDCGAVTAVALNERLPGSMPRLVDNIRMAVLNTELSHPELKGEALVPLAIEANVWQAIGDLFIRSPIAREEVKSGKLQVLGALFDIATGKVDWLGPHPEQARLLGY